MGEMEVTIEILSILIYVALLFGCLIVQASYALKTAGLSYGLSARDHPQPRKGAMGRRIDRTIENLKEGSAMYLPLALLTVNAEISNTWTYYAALVTICSRLIYVPIYILGVPVIRTLVWAPSLFAIPVLAYGFYQGMLN